MRLPDGALNASKAADVSNLTDEPASAADTAVPNNSAAGATHDVVADTSSMGVVPVNTSERTAAESVNLTAEDIWAALEYDEEKIEEAEEVSEIALSVSYT